MTKLFDVLPKKVAIATIALASSAIIFLLLFFTLGAARDNAIASNARLKDDLSETQGRLGQSQNDFQFVSDNVDRYEVLMAGDKLVPHSRRVAVRTLQERATGLGLTRLDYTFGAASSFDPAVVSVQSQATDYQVSVENIEVKVGAPYDGLVYSFIDTISNDFPGSMVVESLELARAREVPQSALNAVARNDDSGLISGVLILSWRTAQKNDSPN